MLRYAYKSQPSVIWWNLVRLGESLGELIGAGPRVDDETFKKDGVTDDLIQEVQERGEKLIMDAGEEYKAVFMAEFRQGMAARLGLKTYKKGDFDNLFTPWLDALEHGEIDFNHSFRRLGKLQMKDLATEEGRTQAAAIFFAKDASPGIALDEAKKRLGSWLDKWRSRIIEVWGEDGDEERRKAMDAVNPNFLPRNWILDELIRRVEKQNEREILQRIQYMSLNPFNDSWSWDALEEARLCGDVPKYKAGLQCSCSS